MSLLDLLSERSGLLLIFLGLFLLLLFALFIDESKEYRAQIIHLL
jgi:hypothetical protein